MHARSKKRRPPEVPYPSVVYKHFVDYHETSHQEHSVVTLKIDSVFDFQRIQSFIGNLKADCIPLFKISEKINAQDFFTLLKTEIHLKEAIVVGPRLDATLTLIENIRSKNSTGLENKILQWYFKNGKGYYSPLFITPGSFSDFKEINRFATNLLIAEPCANSGSNQAMISRCQKLAALDIIIKKNSKTMFEHFAYACLNEEMLQENTDQLTLIDGQATVDIRDLNFRGYKISKSHMKLGSKIHVRDFYYASTLFQSSYFITRFTLLLVKYIVNEIEGQKREHPGHTTLVSYGKYSEPLVFQVISKLRQIHPNLHFDYEIISDTEEAIALRNIKIQERDHIFILVPIGTTLSTGIKIRNFLNSAPYFIKESSIRQPYINLLVSASGALDNQRAQAFNRDKKNKNDILSQYGWEHIDVRNQIITVSSLDSKPQKIQQKYFLALSTKWYNINSCKLCFPDHPIEEIPLIETDRTSVTPQLILNGDINHGQIDAISTPFISLYEKSRDILLDRSYHHYGHILYEGEEHVHFLNPVKFLETHKVAIEEWLKAKKVELMENYNHGRQGEKKLITLEELNITLISPQGNLNSNFSSLINDIIFDGRANVIQYDTKNDFVENFVQIYHQTIFRSDCIYFIDDLILTGKTFHSSNNFIRQCLLEYETGLPLKGFDSVFVLISRASVATLAGISAELPEKKYPKTIYCFKNIAIPPLKVPHMECPICAQGNTYRKIGQSSSLNSTRAYFFQKAGNRRLTDFDKDQLGKPSDVYQLNVGVTCELTAEVSQDYPLVDKYVWLNKTNRHLIKLIITDLMMSPAAEDIFDRIDNVFKLKGNEMIRFVKTKQVLKQYHLTDQETQAMLIKVLTLPPFVNYKSKREKVFHSLLFEAQSTFLKIVGRDAELSDELQGKLSRRFYDFSYLKLILKKLSNFKSNYLLRKSTLTMFFEIYQMGGQSGEEKNFRAYRAEQLHRYQTFKAQYKELLQSLKPESPGQHGVATLTERAHSGKISAEEKYKKIIDYCNQAIANIGIIDKSLNGFQYFIVACIKEVIFSNEAKAIKLEENINQIFRKPAESALYGISPEFYHLLRVIKLENTGILTQYLDKTVATRGDLLGEIDFSYVNRQKKNYAIKPLYDFLVAENHSLGLKGQIANIPFNQFMKIYSFLHSESIGNENGTRMPLIDKIRFLLTKILVLFELNDINAEISINLSDKSFERKKTGKKNTSLYAFTNGKEISKAIKADSFAYLLHKGIAANQPGIQQTLVEYRRVGEDYQTLVADLFDFKGDKINHMHQEKSNNVNRLVEFSDNPTHLLFFRIAPFGSEGTEQPSLAVLTIRVNQKKKTNWYFPIERLRYLVCLQSKIANFIQVNTENDAFQAYIEEKRDLMSLTRYRHGLDNYFNQIKSQLNNLRAISPYTVIAPDTVTLSESHFHQLDENEDKRLTHIKYVEEYLTLGFYQILMSRELVEIQKKNRKDKMRIFSDSKKFHFGHMTVKGLENRLRDRLGFVFSISNPVDPMPKLDFKGFDITLSFKIIIEIFDMVILEIMTNAFKYINYEDNCSVSFEIKKRASQTYLEVRNSFGSDASKMQRDMIFSEGKGLMMINDIYLKLFEDNRFRYSNPKSKKKIFTVRLPLILKILE
ncbi:hypothetical protein IM793_06245 [Pedobacter sp. MR2016-19]|uniref:hypothetical protein n=1 Tax=Pedobacter sp. MR2016-19 TaxID=2780089 RepID=UPI0018754FDF|nr:hypothetical protein [Pedobacter sp. MR2016-19]MBE5318745.1 hypothetical protein [Pedobacter sp. MR2016-19]